MLHARFREHTMKLFEKHGMTNLDYWTPDEAPLFWNTLIYILAHPSREAAKQNREVCRGEPVRPITKERYAKR